MNNINKPNKGNKFFYVYTSTDILLISHVYICRISFKPQYCKNIISMKNTLLSSDHLPRLLKGRTLTATLILSVAILFDCVAIRLVFVSSPPQLTVLSTSFYDTHNKRSLLLIAGTATCFLRKEILFHRSAGYYVPQ